MIYLVTGEKSLNNLEIDKILKKEKDYSLIKYDLEENSILQVVDELNTVDLFSPKKIVIVYSFSKIEKEHEDYLVRYIEKSEDSNILILVTTEKLDERKKLTKLLKAKSKIIDTTNTNVDTYIKEELKDYKIDFGALSLLKDYTNNNYNKICQEINKLKMLKLDEKVITKDDVTSVVRKSFDKNIFDFTNAINEKNKKKMFDIYYELIENKEDELKILGVLANNFRLLYKVKILKDIKSESELMSLLNIKNPKRLYILKQETYKYDKNDLLRYLKELSELDIKIKSGLIDKKLGMEIFLTKI